MKMTNQEVRDKIQRGLDKAATQVVKINERIRRLNAVSRDTAKWINGDVNVTITDDDGEEYACGEYSDKTYDFCVDAKTKFNELFDCIEQVED